MLYIASYWCVSLFERRQLKKPFSKNILRSHSVSNGLSCSSRGLIVVGKAFSTEMMRHTLRSFSTVRYLKVMMGRIYFLFALGFKTFPTGHRPCVTEIVVQ